MSARLGALGGPHTFGGQAARAMLELRPDLGAVAYLPNSAELFADDGNWRVDAACVPAHTSRAGAHLSTHRKLADRPDMYVVGEIEHAYRCALLVRSGTRLTDIRTVLGHTGSHNQSRAWLGRMGPDADLMVVDTHSRGAALAVAAGDGTLAAVGTTDLADETGLEILEHDIDDGSIGLYWAVGPRLLMSSTPDRVVVAGTTGATPSHQDLTATLRLLHVTGYAVAAVFSEAVGDRLLHNRVVLYCHGSAESSLQVLASGLELIAPFRLAGAYALNRPPDKTESRRPEREGAPLVV